MTTSTLIPPVPIVPSFKLGKLEPLHDPRTLMLADYLDRASLPRVPSSHAWSSRVHSWPMLANDVHGDCALASPGHMIQMWTSYTQPAPFVPTDQQILDAYSAVSGFDQRTGTNDVGCNMLDVLKYWKGQGVAGHKIAGYAAVQPQNPKLVATGMFLFGGVNVGLALPASAQNQVASGQPWTLTHGPSSQPGTWGGHAVPIVDYDPASLTCITWGRLQKMTWQWFLNYCDECWVVISDDWLYRHQVSPSGLTLDALKQDIALV